jgi:hypothetical protein
MPFPGSTFKVTANEVTFGPGILSILDNSVLFEARDRRYFGFDFNKVRLVRVRNINSLDIAYSTQGSIQRASFAVAPKYIRKNEGIEKDVTTNPFEWELTFWKLHAITGAVVARVVADRSKVQIEGVTPTSDEEFERDFKNTSALIQKLPSKDEIVGGVNKKAEFRELDQQLNEAMLKLTDAWLMGNLSPSQRVKVAALCYLSNAKKHERGWFSTESETGGTPPSNQEFKESADEWTKEESLWGSDLKSLI